MIYKRSQIRLQADRHVRITSWIKSLLRSMVAVNAEHAAEVLCE